MSWRTAERAWDRARATPWKVRNEMRRFLVHPWVRVRFGLAGVPMPPGARFYGVPVVQRHRDSSISISDQPTLRSTVRSNPLGPGRPVILSTRSSGARIDIGKQFGMTGGSIVAGSHIWIGHRVTVGSECLIIDTDFHPLDAGRRHFDSVAGQTEPVRIEDDVFIGMRCLILKGSIIGKGSVIGAGSVVTGEVPPGVVAAGNPAQVIKKIDSGS